MAYSNSSAATTNLHSPTYGSDPTTPNTTFIQADPSNFRAVVQKLTGASDDPSAQKLPLTLPSRLASAQAHRPTTTSTPDIGPKKPNFKLHERRANKKLELNIGVSETPNIMFHNHSMNSVRGGGGSSRGMFYMGEMVNVMASPVSPLELLARGSPRTPKSPEQEEEEQRVVVEKGFYLHPKSPLTTPRPSHPPQLLPLFPLHSPNSHPNNSSS